MGGGAIFLKFNTGPLCFLVLLAMAPSNDSDLPTALLHNPIFVLVAIESIRSFDGGKTYSEKGKTLMVKYFGYRTFFARKCGTTPVQLLLGVLPTQG